MYLLEMKKQILNLIEEANGQISLTDDPDIKAKLNDVINQIMFEVARYKKIPEVRTVKFESVYRLESLPNFYQLENVLAKNKNGEEIEADVFGKNLIFPEAGTALIKYYKYPDRITNETEDDVYEFELTDDALEVIPYGVAGDILKSDISNQYGKTYSERYREMLQNLDPRYNTGSIFIEV